MEETTDLKADQEMISNTLSKETQKVLAEKAAVKSAVSKHINRKLTERQKCDRQRRRATGMTTALRGLSRKDFQEFRRTLQAVN